MAKRNKSILPGLVGKDTKSLSLDGIKNALNTRGSSALPAMKYFGDVKPSRNERIIKPDMTYGNKVIKQDLPTIREVLKPGFSGNFRTNYTPQSLAPAFAFSNALSFDGVNDNVSFTTISKPTLTAGFSVSMWVKFNATPSSEFILGNSASIYNQLLFISPTQAYFRTRAAGASITYFNFPAISTGTWYYIAVSLVTTVNELWIDGVKYTGTTHNYDNETISFNQIGLSGTNYGQFVIDELALKVGSGLTQQNVDDLYNGGLGQFATDVITDPDVYYRLNGSGTDTTAIDDSGNSNTGTLNGFTGTYWVAH